MKPAISVVIPAFNVEAYVARSMESVLAQTFTDLEILVVDDASTDKTGAVVQALAQEHACIHLLTRKENKGLGEARNLGTQAAQGEYIFYLDSDDWIEPQTLEVLYRQAQEQGADVIACGARYAYDDGTFQSYHAETLVAAGGRDALGKLAKYKIGTIAWNKLYKKSLILEHEIRFLPIYHEDVNFAIEVAYYCEKFVSVSDVYCNYYQRKDSISNKKISPQHLIGYFEIIKFIQDFFAVHPVGTPEETANVQEQIGHSQMQWIIPNVLRYLESVEQAESKKVFQQILPAYFGSGYYFVQSILDYFQWYLYRREPFQKRDYRICLKKFWRDPVSFMRYLLPYGLVKLLHKDR